MKPLLAAFLLALATPLAAQEVRPADLPRLEALDAVLGNALRRAFAGGAPADAALLAQALAGEPGPLDPKGGWSCRTLKLGGLLPLTVYQPFRCRIAPGPAPGTWTLEKLSGSQRLSGTLTDQGTIAVYTGVGFVDGGPSASYDALPPDDQTPQEPGQTHAQVGVFEQASPSQARLLLPAPLFESDFDILWLTR